MDLSFYNQTMSLMCSALLSHVSLRWSKWHQKSIFTSDNQCHTTNLPIYLCLGSFRSLLLYNRSWQRPRQSYSLFLAAQIDYRRRHIKFSMISQIKCDFTSKQIYTHTCIYLSKICRMEQWRVYKLDHTGLGNFLKF